MTDQTVMAKPIGKAQNIALWLVQILLAFAFLMAGSSKLTGAPKMVAMFHVLGLGQWFRYLTGSLEVVGAIAILTPFLCGAGGLLLTCVMIGAVLTHLLKLGGNPGPAIVLLILSAVVAWGRRDTLLRLLGR